MKKNLNIVVVGKSGAGKSSLLNYLVEKDIFETGIGSPVTQDYFNVHEYQHPTKDVKYNLYDTKGIEPDTVAEFEENVYNKIEEFANSEDFFEHIHTLYFCIAASSKRIEPFEVNFIKRISKTVDVVIVLTKSDLVSTEEKTEFKKVLETEVGASEHDVDAHVRVIEVCSVEIRTRKGTSLPYGKEDVLNHSFLGLWSIFAKHISQNIYDVVYIDSIRTNFSAYHIKVDKESDKIKKVLFLEQWKKDSLVNNYSLANFTFYDAICLHPLEQIGLNLLSNLDRLIIREILNSSLRIYAQIPTLLIYLEELKNSVKTEINEIIDFYSNLTSNTISIPVPLQLSNNKIDEIKEVFKEENVKVWKSNVNYLLELLSKDNSSDGWISSTWNTDIKKEFNDCYAEYFDICSSINNEIRGLLNEQKNILHTEIISYGNLIIAPLNNNENEKAFIADVRFALEDDNMIDDSEKRFLERTRINNSISEEKATEIIRQVKYELGI